MKRFVSIMSGIAVATVGFAVVGVAGADNNGKPRRVRAVLTGYSEVVPVGGALSTTGRGTFRAEIDEASQIITYTLRYSGLEGTATMSHLHFGQHHTTGGVSVWLCQTATNPSPTPGTPQCSSDVSGMITPVHVIGPAAQGIGEQQFAELVAAIRAGVVYVNVHSTLYPPGEIRGQLF
jgi:hypothetical protein